ncbi:hypothetical protein IVB12_02270 [Bradyrhizobium sp. 179]|uniref:hypothetical protein n=1 Tax=Bradyrhizobium sp. 179 TaxID=2782648 RepID=UPI001FFAB0CC|nr:hypothetical protein [Bradyrhizobium sp. 179]MCK1540847.1 hypothetical protein [Bradyrhizobium sp. 179]
MSDAADSSSFSFEFIISREEDRFFRRLAKANLKALIDWRSQMTLALTVYAFMIVASYIALRQEWLTPPAVFAAILCLVVGQLYMYFVSSWISRQIFEKLFELDRLSQKTRHVIFDDFSIVHRGPNTESRMSWDEIATIQDSPVMVAFWYSARQGFFIPARVIGDSSARAAFVEWAGERLRRPAIAADATRPTKLFPTPERS